ncbi:hypothetical protein B5X24_HaOG203846 [Helicoverpa armigera]|nr:hypothetical protein B5X24_HaOG203846 [Helicoverpa armigera]
MMFYRYIVLFQLFYLYYWQKHSIVTLVTINLASYNVSPTLNSQIMQNEHYYYFILSNGVVMAHPHLREAAESLLSSVSPHHRTLTHSTSLNLVSDDLVAGHRPQGKMSTVRRFFCLFVTFDLLFTSLMWLICVMATRQDVYSAALLLSVCHVRPAVHQPHVAYLCYDARRDTTTNNEHRDSGVQREGIPVRHSDGGCVSVCRVTALLRRLFDIVMVAVCRFVVLLLFYAVLYINNWSIIALSTGCTCALLIAKVFVFDWPNAVQPVYEVFLILTSFTLAWGEAWFLDFRVLPQELQAKQILESIVHHGASERTPLLPPLAGQSQYAESTVKWFSPVETPESSPRPRRTPLLPPLAGQSQYAESTVKWFSPVETPESSPRPRRPGEQVILTQEQDIIIAGFSSLKQWFYLMMPTGASERTPLLPPTAGQSQYAESTVKWFSPVETPESSPRPRRPGEQVILTQEQVTGKT